MNILLINPPFESEDSVGESSSVRFVLNITPPLGLAYLGAALEREGCRVKIIDYTARVAYPPLVETIRLFKPDVIGFTATTPSFESAAGLAQKVRAINSDIPLIIGGAHVTADPEGTVASGIFDVGVISEAEETIVELIEELGGNGISPNLRRVRGIAYRDSGEIIRTLPRPFINNLDVLPSPAFRLLPPLRSYHPTPASYRYLPLGILITSRGCPFRCTFCDRSVFGNTIRYQSPERILEDIDKIVGESGAREIRFFDDTFTLNRERTLAICDGLRKRESNIPWTCLTTVKTVTPELLQAMKRAGCWQVLYGLESGDERMLKILGKGNTVEQNRQAVRWTKEAGLEVRADFIVGTPGETMESLENTLRFALETDLDYAHFNKFVPFPGTALYKQLIEAGLSFDFTHGCSIVDHGALLYVPDSLTPEQYRSWLDRAFKRFYLRPSHLRKRLTSIRTWTQLKGQVRGAFSIINL